MSSLNGSWRRIQLFIWSISSYWLSCCNNYCRGDKILRPAVAAVPAVPAVQIERSCSNRNLYFNIAGNASIRVPRNRTAWEMNMNTTLKRTLVIGGAVVLVAAGLIFAATRPKHGSGAPPSPEVEVVQVEQKDVPIYGEWIGTLDGFTNADVRAQVTGYLMRQGYQEGAFVKQGQLLFQIDPRPFQAALDQAEGQLAQAKANLANAKAQQGRTQLDVDRYTPLAREQAASQQDLDNSVQNNLAAKATVQKAEAQIKTDDAAVETAKINLDFTRLIAPIDGIAGQAQLQVGALVNPSSGAVTSVSTVDPIKVYFTVSESEY